VNRIARPLAWAATSTYCDELLGFRVDLELAGPAGGPCITLAGDYAPTPLSSIAAGLGRVHPEAALDMLLQPLRRAAMLARPPAMRAEPVAGEAALTLCAAVVKAPLVPRQRTSFAEIAGQRSRWREVASFGWRGESCDARRSAYELLGALELQGMAL
jgi:hypothetical protein